MEKHDVDALVKSVLENTAKLEPEHRHQLAKAAFAHLAPRTAAAELAANVPQESRAAFTTGLIQHLPDDQKKQVVTAGLKSFSKEDRKAVASASGAFPVPSPVTRNALWRIVIA